jgi:hypothetical protein
MTLDLTNPKHTLQTMAEKIQAMNQNIEEVTFHTLDGAILPKNEILMHRNNIPFVMSLKRKGTSMAQNYAINLNQSYSISN